MTPITEADALLLMGDVSMASEEDSLGEDFLSSSGGGGDNICWEEEEGVSDDVGGVACDGVVGVVGVA